MASNETTHVRLYGGPAHGKLVTVDQIPWRIETVAPERGRPDYLRRISEEDLINWQPRERVSYHIQWWHIQARNPKRHKHLPIGVVEGCELLPRERYDLQRDMDDLPWSFPSVSFLHEFEEWWSQTLYRHTGRLTWRNEPVYW